MSVKQSELDMVLVEKRWKRTRKGIKRPNPKELMRVRGRARDGGREKVASQAEASAAPSHLHLG